MTRIRVGGGAASRADVVGTAVGDSAPGSTLGLGGPGASLVGVVGLDSAGRLRSVNEAATRLLRVESTRNLIGTPFRALCASEALLRALDGTPPSTGLAELIAGDGNAVAIEFEVGVARRGADGVVCRLGFVPAAAGAAEQMRLGRDRAQQFLDVADVVILVLAPDGTVSLINRTGLELLGCAEHEVVGANWFDEFLPPSSREEHREKFRHGLAGDPGLRTHVENAIITRRGTLRLISWRNTNLTDEAGRVTGTLSSGADVTEIRAAEAALRASEQRFRDFGTAASDWFWEMDAELRFTYFSDRFESISGVPPATLLGRTRRETGIPGVDESAWRAHIAEIEAHRPFRDFVHPRTLADGSVVWLSVNGLPVFDARGEFTGYRGSGSDVTERRNAQAALRESEARIKAILDHSPTPITLKDTLEHYVLVNRQFERIHGLTLDAVRGRTVHDVRPPAIAARVAAHNRKVMSSGVPAEREERIVIDGQERAYSVTDFPVLDARGEAIGVGSIATDVTQRIRMQEDLEESRRVLSTLLSNLPGMAYRVRFEGGCLIDFVSEGCLELTGFPPEQVVGRRDGFLVDLAHPDDRESMRGLARQRMEDRRPFQLTYRIITAGGDLKWVWEQGRGVYDADGRLLSVEGFVSDVTEARTLSDELSHQASHDALTGLLNRRAFEDRLTRVLESAQSSGERHVLCYLDLDQFKVINDTCGHVAGDELLRQLGALLHERVRRRDTLARLGGDEFGLLMEHCSIEQAGRVAESLREVVEEFRFVWQDRGFALGVSMGLVEINETSAGISDVMSAVDSACYVAKDQGRNRIHVYRPDDAQLMRRHGEMQWVPRIDAALAAGRFQLAFQSIVPISVAARGHHFEILLRMVGDDGELIAPGAFLPAAERYNLLVRIDRWVIAAALDWLASNPGFTDGLHLCSINLSGHSLADDAFLDYVNERFDETGVPPEKLCFEVTETAAIANLSSAARFIRALRSRGSLFALDDFGSGLSSFAYLKALPVDFLKIDGQFVKDIVDDPMDLAMVRSIHEIGRVMGKETIAEFVESDAILAKLGEIGVDYAQGYGIGRPRPLKSLAGNTPSPPAGLEASPEPLHG